MKNLIIAFVLTNLLIFKMIYNQSLTQRLYCPRGCYSIILYGSMSGVETSFSGQSETKYTRQAALFIWFYKIMLPICFQKSVPLTTLFMSSDWLWKLGFFADTTSKVLLMTTFFSSLFCGFTDVISCTTKQSLT